MSTGNHYVDAILWGMMAALCVDLPCLGLWKVLRGLHKATKG